VEEKKILIVDDEEVFCKILERRLKSFGYQSKYATLAKEGLKIAKEITPDVFILDWMMPDMDGLELTKAIRAEKGLEGAYIIILTAKSGSTETAEALETGADEFLTKPVEDDELKARVRAGIRISDLYRELKIKNLELAERSKIISRNNIELEKKTGELEDANKKLKKAHSNLIEDNKALEKLCRIAPQLEEDAEGGGKLAIPGGKLYLVDEERPTLALQYFSNMVHKNIPGLGITRRHPKEIKETYNLKTTPLVWLTQNKSQDDMVLLPDTTKFSSVVTSFLGKTENGVVLIEGLEYLISQTEFEAVLKLIQFLNDKVMGTSNIIIITMDTQVLDQKEQRFFKRELADLESASSDIFLGSIKDDMENG